MNEGLRQLVWDRAASICEYCRVPQLFDPLPFGVDHIRPHYHHGATVEENLCLCCFHDNTFNAVNLAGWSGRSDHALHGVSGWADHAGSIGSHPP